MSHFAESLHPDDVPPSHLGEWVPDDIAADETEGEDDENERTD